jgi:hypothetical protein
MERQVTGIGDTHLRRIAYVTAGNLGCGHLVRGIAIRRALRRLNYRCDFGIFAPAPRNLDIDESIRSEISFVAMPERELNQRARARHSALRIALTRFRPDLVVVDMFWAAMFHVLRSLAVPAWLLVRKVPNWWWRVDRTISFDSRQYERVFRIEPCSLPMESTALNPLVVCNLNECAMPHELRAHWPGAAGSLEVLVHAGRAGERQTLANLAAPGRPLRTIARFPACRWLPAADRIVCAAGYNSFWESKWLGYFAKCTFLPFTRSADDQAWRLHACSQVLMSANGADELASQIRAYL